MSTNTTSSIVTTTSLSTSSSTPTTSSIPTTSSLIPTTSSSLVQTTTLEPSTSIITAPTSTTYIPPTSTAPPSTSVVEVTSVVTRTPSSNGQTQPAIVTTIYSTQPVVTITPTASSASSASSTASSSSATRSPLSASGSSGKSSGLSSGATIAIAVIIPIIAVIGLVIFGLWFWRRRKAKQNDAELRKNEMAEYGFNPNNDPNLPVAAAAYGTDVTSEGNDDSGYRGWGATTASNRKASTTLGSNSHAGALAGVGGTAMSDHGSNGYSSGMQPSPSAGGESAGTQDPLVQGYPEAATAGAVGAAALGGAAVGAQNNNNRYSQASALSGVRRGPSNASSAYSGAGGAHSEASSDVPEVPSRPYYQEEVPYNIYNDVQPGHGPYGDSTYAGQDAQPVIRDVQARRNTRIERAPTFPQQGGIAQNF